ncbi:MAG: glycosyltransferase [Oscillospiraceae bacterium]|jgi:glycosyltransferase involved in cell wall biosynthesis|nr:glycosyltransferase [Oscillospiraceae bacterium]
MNPAVSIVCPVYNVAKYLDDCVGSVLAQSFVFWELWLVDDGATDESPRICDAWAACDARIHALHQENAGVSAARNAGLAQARGRYVAFLDADDCFAPTYLQVLVDAAEKEQAQLVLCAYQPFCGDFKTAIVTFARLPRGGFGRDVICGALADAMLRSGGLNSAGMKLFLRETIEGGGVRFAVGKTNGEDREFVLRYLALCDRAAYAPGAVYQYREVADSAVWSLRRDPADRIREQYENDLLLFAALGVSKERMEAGLLEGVAVETYHEIWRLAQNDRYRLAHKQLRRLVRSWAGQTLRAMPRAVFLCHFPGRSARVLRLLLWLRLARGMRLFIRTFFRAP